MMKNYFKIRPDKNLLIKFLIISAILSLVIFIIISFIDGFKTGNIILSAIFLVIIYTTFTLVITPFLLFESLTISGDTLLHKQELPWLKKDLNINQIIEINERHVRTQGVGTMMLIDFVTNSERITTSYHRFKETDVTKLIELLVNINPKILDNFDANKQE